MLHDDAKQGWLQNRPILAISLGDGNEVAAQENADHTVGAKQACRQRRALRRHRAVEISCALQNDTATGQKLEGRRIWGFFSLNEHYIAPLISYEISCTEHG